MKMAAANYLLHKIHSIPSTTCTTHMRLAQFVISLRVLDFHTNDTLIS
jgi:hypothetical protein